MRPARHSRLAVLAIAAGVSLLMVAPVAGQTEERIIEPAPAILPATGHVMGSGGLGSPQENPVIVLAPAAAPSWDATSGYGSVEANRAANALAAAPDALANQVSSDVRWASAPADSLTAPVATTEAWDATSGYGAVEASRAAMSQAETPGYLGAALAAGIRAESAHLATISLPDQPE